MFRIGEFSKLSKTTIKTLRYYDKVGLLKPAFVDSKTSYRYYTDEQLSVIQKIHLYKSVGLPNEDIGKILSTGSSGEILQKHKNELSKYIEWLNAQNSEIDKLLNPDREAAYSAVLKVIDARIVYYCQGYISTPNHIRDFIKACGTELKRSNPDVRYSLPDYCCIIYPGQSYRETNLFIEYAQSVDRIGIDSPILKFRELESITAVSVEHHGSYSNLRKAYLYAVNWAAENGFEVQGSARERYINGSWNCDNESQWLTEVQLPVKPIATRTGADS